MSGSLEQEMKLDSFSRMNLTFPVKCSSFNDRNFAQNHTLKKIDTFTPSDELPTEQVSEGVGDDQPITNPGTLLDKGEVLGRDQGDGIRGEEEPRRRC